MSQVLSAVGRLDVAPQAPALSPPPPRRLPGWMPRDAGLLVLIVLPLLLLVLDSTWIFGNHPCDAWYYFGYYFDFSGHLKSFDPSYYGGRLSTILVGALVYGCLPPLLANYVLHLGLYWASVLALYATLARTAGRRGAFLAALFLGCYVHFLQAIGWDYVDGFGVAYTALTTLALTVAADSRRWRLWLLAAGAGAAALIVAQLIWGLVLPGLLGLYAVANRQGRRHPLGASALYLAAGAAGLVLALGCFHWWYAGGQFWFLLPSFQFLFGFAGSPASATYKVRPAEWLPTASHLVLPAITLVGAVGALVWTRGRRRQGWSPTMRFFQVQFLVNLALFVLSEGLPGGCFLTYPLYASLLIPSLFLAFGAQLHSLVKSLSRGQFALVAGLTLGVLILPTAWPGFWQGVSAHPRRVMAFYCLPGLAALIVWRWPGLVGHLREPQLGRVAGIVALLCLLPLLGESIAYFLLPHKSLPLVVQALLPGLAALALLLWPRPSVGRAGLFVLLLSLSQLKAYPGRPLGNVYGHDSYQVVVQSMRAVQAVDPTSHVYFWFDAEEANADSYLSLACTYNWGYRLINTRFPALAAADAEAKPGVATRFCWPPAPGMKVALLSQAADVVARANRSLHHVGLEAHPLASSPIDWAKVQFTMTFVEIVPWTAPEETGSLSAGVR